MEALGSWFSLTVSCDCVLGGILFCWSLVVESGLQPGGFFLFVCIFFKPFRLSQYMVTLTVVISGLLVSHLALVLKAESWNKSPSVSNYQLWLVLLSFSSFLVLFHRVSPRVIFKGNSDANSCHL